MYPISSDQGLDKLEP